MYGWRARLGFITPMDNAVIEPELYSLGLEGVAYYTVRLTTGQRPEMPPKGVELSAIFNELGVDAVGYACAETSFLGGQDANAWIAEQIERVTGKPAVTATQAMIEAVGALGASSVALAAPYPASSAERLRDFFERSGHRVTRLETRDFAEGSADPRDWYETNLQPPATAYQLARAADTPEADVVVICATNFRSVEVIQALEADLRKPVISTNSALLWSLLGRCSVRLEVPALGRLFSLQSGSRPTPVGAAQ